MTSRSLRNPVIATAAVALLAGCAAGPGPFGPREQTPIPAGSTLVLQRPLDLATGAARVFLQEGHVVPTGSGMSRFRPRCSFGLEKLDGEPLMPVIEPDRFRTGPARTRGYAHGRPRGHDGVHLASRPLSLGLGFGLLHHRRERHGYITYAIEIPLSSDNQPQVDDFTCKVDRPHHWRGRLGLEAIRQAAGDIVQVELAEPDADSEDGY